MAAQKGQNKGVLVDVQTHEKGGMSVVDVFIRPEGVVNPNIRLEDTSFPPYFYVSLVPAAEPKRIAKELSQETFPGGIKPVYVKHVKKDDQDFLQIGFSTIAQLVNTRETIFQYPFVQNIHESNIPYTKRYLLDKQLIPYTIIEYSLKKDGTIQSIAQTNESNAALKWKTGAFDIETFGTRKIPEPEHDLIISLAAETPAGKKVFLQAPFSNEYTNAFANEKDMLTAFMTFIQLSDLDILYTYNGDHFDFPFVDVRSKKYNVSTDFGFGGIQFVGKNTDKQARLHGIQHVDVYQLVRLLSRFQFLKLTRMDLESVMRAVFNEGEKTLTHKEIWQTWKDQRGFDKLVKYNLTDAEYTKRLGDEFLPLVIEIARLVGITLFDANRSTASQLVETTLMREAVRLNKPIPNSPTDEQVMGRQQNPIEGAYVKEPVAGLHENLAVLDFRSLYPSIMISHNISPDMLDCAHPACKEGGNKSPTGHWFCAKQKGLFSQVLERILDARIGVQEKMDILPKKDPQMVFLKARKQALKIILNSFFGTLGYPRFRWYNREAARAITAWARHYIHQTLEWAEQDGFRTVYADTDSCFMIVDKKTEADVKAFVEKVNKKLPGRMELEFEGLYKRGLFVTKKEGKAAKKRYALAGFDDELTIVGFEYVRRDVSMIARETQKKVLNEILVKGDPKRALEIVQEVVVRLRAGKVPKKELIILTQLQRRPDSYATTGPHVQAALRAQKRGKEIHVGQMLGFIITSKGKSISEKAELEEFAKEGDYDAEYYINNQILPAIERIFVELGYDPEDLKNKGKQTGLGAFM